MFTGALSNEEEVTENFVQIAGSSIETAAGQGCSCFIYGGGSASDSEARGNSLWIENSELFINSLEQNTAHSLFLGGGFSGGSAKKNKVCIKDSYFNSPKKILIAGGVIQDSTGFNSGIGTASDNIVSIWPGTEILSGDSVLVYGAYAINESSSTISSFEFRGNSVNIYNIREGVRCTNLYIIGWDVRGLGGVGDSRARGNVLKIVTDDLFEVYGIGRFDKIEIRIVYEDDEDNEDPPYWVSTEECQNLNGIVEISFSPGTIYKLGDSFIAVHSKNPDRSSFNNPFPNQRVKGEYKSLLHQRKSTCGLVLRGNDIEATVEKDETTVRSESVSYLCSRAASLRALDASEDEDIGDILETTCFDSELKGLQPFGRISGGRNTCNDIGQGLNLRIFECVGGVANKMDMSGDTVIWALGFDFGRGRYDVESRGEASSWKVNAEGGVSNLGIIMYGKATLGEGHGKLANMYLDGSAGFGNQKTDYRTDDIESTIPTGSPNKFDYSVPYLKVHIGCGVEYPPVSVADKKMYIDTYVKYRVCNLVGVCVGLSDDEVLIFHGTCLHYARLGLKGVVKLKSNISLSSGLFFEQGVGKVRAESERGFQIEDLSMAGTTIDGKLGIKIDIKEEFKIYLVLEGSAISRTGCNLMVNLVWLLGRSISKKN
jgi:hypothetical protein